MIAHPPLRHLRRADPYGWIFALGRFSGSGWNPPSPFTPGTAQKPRLAAFICFVEVAFVILDHVLTAPMICSPVNTQ